jgi:hypothetical protein
VLLKISILDRVDPVSFRGLVQLVLLATIPYLVAGLMIHLLWRKSLRRKIPSWAMIALLGALLVVVSAGAVRLYTNPLASDTTIGAFVVDRAKDGLGVFVFLSLFTFPITAVVYYAESIVRGVRRWYEYGAEPPSILHDRERR